ncbi:hypothetical protein LCGC14_2002170 [marine sediment metagenome]|uniref:Uncharacterized protein n=1 Tax=marine sediment metagenome TaxID=412755 RepID=A0A0F9HG84_9ZZZZ
MDKLLIAIIILCSAFIGSVLGFVLGASVEAARVRAEAQAECSPPPVVKCECICPVTP